MPVTQLFKRLDDCLDGDKIRSQLDRIMEDCDRYGIEWKDKPLRVVMEEIRQARENDASLSV